MNWASKARQRLQERADKLFNDWGQTDAGKRWKVRRRRVSPYTCGFSLPDYHRDLIEALNRGDEELAKGIMLAHYI